MVRLFQGWWVWFGFNAAMEVNEALNLNLSNPTGINCQFAKCKKEHCMLPSEWRKQHKLQRETDQLVSDLFSTKRMSQNVRSKELDGGFPWFPHRAGQRGRWMGQRLKVKLRASATESWEPLQEDWDKLTEQYLIAIAERSCACLQLLDESNI